MDGDIRNKKRGKKDKSQPGRVPRRQLCNTYNKNLSNPGTSCITFYFVYF